LPFVRHSGTLIFACLRGSRGCAAQNERETRREPRKLNGECSVVEGPSGVSTAFWLNL
jgi:hypothetical protein